jgi:hypothetical protein
MCARVNSVIALRGTRGLDPASLLPMAAQALKSPLGFNQRCDRYHMRPT